MSANFRKRVVLAVMTLIAFVPAGGNTQTPSLGSVEGRVHIGAGDAGTVLVQLQHLGMTVQEQFSADGSFTFWNVPYGPYILLIRVPGHEEVSQEISIPGKSPVSIEVGTRTRLPAEATVSVLELQVPKSARRKYEQARERMRDGDCSSALQYLTEAIRLFAGYSDAHNAIGTCHVRLQHPTLAEEAFKTAIAFTSSVYPGINLADVYIKQGRLQEADAVLTQALRQNPTQGDAYYGLALLRVEQHRLDEAEQLANEAHDHSRHIEDVHLLLAQIHQRQGRMDLIPADLERYLQEAKPSPTRERVQKMLEDSGYEDSISTHRATANAKR